MQAKIKFENNNVRGMSPIGIARFPRLTKPDPMYGGYKVGLLLDPQDPKTQELSKKVTAVFESCLKQCAAALGKSPDKIKKVDLPFKPDTDKDGNETGKIRFTFKGNETIKQPGGLPDKKVCPTLYGPDAKPWDSSKDIGGGSLVRVRFTISAFYNPAVGFGVKMYLDEAQVVKLVNADRGFEAIPTDEAGDDGFSEAAGSDAAGGGASGTDF